MPNIIFVLSTTATDNTVGATGNLADLRDQAFLEVLLQSEDRFSDEDEDTDTNTPREEEEQVPGPEGLTTK